MRGWILLGLTAAILMAPSVVADDMGLDEEDDSRTCVYSSPHTTGVNPTTCAKAVFATVEWVVDQVILGEQ